MWRADWSRRRQGLANLLALFNCSNCFPNFQFVFFTTPTVEKIRIPKCIFRGPLEFTYRHINQIVLVYIDFIGLISLRMRMSRNGRVGAIRAPKSTLLCWVSGRSLCSSPKGAHLRAREDVFQHWGSSVGKKMIKVVIKGGSHRVRLSSFVLIFLKKHLHSKLALLSWGHVGN